MPGLVAIDHDSDNAAAQVVIAAVTGKRIIVSGIDVSFDIAPATGGSELKLTFAAAVVYKLDIGDIGVKQIRFPGGFAAGVSEAVTVDLAASGTAGTDAQLNVLYDVSG